MQIIYQDSVLMDQLCRLYDQYDLPRSKLVIAQQKVKVIIIKDVNWSQSYQSIISYYEVLNSLTQVTLSSLSKEKFSNLQTLTIYFSNWTLYNEQYFDVICQSLMKLPKLELFTAVVYQIISDSSFKPLGDRFKAEIDKKWRRNEEW